MNSFPLRRAAPVPHPLSALAAILGSPDPGSDMEVRGIAPVDQATEAQLGLVAHRSYLAGVAGSRAGALMVSNEIEPFLPEDARPRLRVPDAHHALAVLLDRFHPEERPSAAVHPTAVLGRGVQLGRDVRIGPYAVVEQGASVGDETSIGAHVVVGAGCRIGRGVVLHPHAVLYPGTVLGNRVILHAGARVGVDGFGYVYQDGAHRKVPQIGACILEDEVEVGANTTVDRGSIGATRVGEGVKIDNLVHLGHNVVVGARSILTGQVGIAGSTRLGEGVQAGGQAGIGGHLSVGDGARLAGQAGVISDVPAGATVMGFPARPRGEFLRTAAAQRRVPELLERVTRLEAAMESLRAEGGTDSETA